jgi:hypothetical protein
LLPLPASHPASYFAEGQDPARAKHLRSDTWGKVEVCCGALVRDAVDTLKIPPKNSERNTISYVYIYNIYIYDYEHVDFV